MLKGSIFSTKKLKSDRIPFTQNPIQIPFLRNGGGGVFLHPFGSNYYKVWSNSRKKLILNHIFQISYQILVHAILLRPSIGLYKHVTVAYHAWTLRIVLWIYLTWVHFIHVLFPRSLRHVVKSQRIDFNHM